MNAFKRNNLRFRLLLLAGVALLPMALMLGYYIIQERDQKLVRLNEDVVRLSEQSAGTLAQLMRSSWQTLASFSVVNLQSTNPAATSQAFADILGQRGIYANAGLAQPDGWLTVSVSPAARGTSCAGMEWFQRAQQSRSFYVGTYELDRFAKQECLTFALPVGAYSSNRPPVAHLSLSLDSLQQAIGQLHLPKDSMLMVLDRNGTELARWPKQPGMRGKKSRSWKILQPAFRRMTRPVECVGRDGVVRFYYFQAVPASDQGLWVGVGFSKTEVMAQTSNNLIWGLVAFLCVSGFGIGLAWTGSERWVLRPVRQLTETAHKLADDDLSARAHTSGAPEELAVMGQAFNEMADKLLARQIELRRTQFAVDHAPDMILWADSAGRFIYGNQSALKALGLTQDELRRRRLQDITNFITPEIWLAHWEELKQRHTLVFEASCFGLNREFPVEAVANYLVFGEQEYDCVFLRDISRRKQAEEKWRRLNSELEARVKERTAEIETANASLLEEIQEKHKIELSLRESQRKLATFLSNLPGLAYRCRNAMDWRMEFVSQGAFELTGYKPEELVGNQTVSYAGTVHPDDANRVWAEVQASLALHETFRLLYRIRCRDGSEKWVSEIGQGVFDDAGDLVALEGIIHDTTERKLAEEEVFRAHAMLGMVLDHVPQRVFWKDLNSRYLGCNRAFAADQKLAHPQDVEGKSDFDLFTHEIAETCIQTDRWVIENNRPKLDYEEPMVISEKETRWLRYNKMPMQNQKGDVVGILGTYEDITESRKMNQVLRESLQTLERSNKELEQFAYVASHDLQEPLRLISSYTQLLASRYQGRLDAKADEFIAYAVDGAKRMQRLIQDLLAYSRVANRDMTLAPVDCAKVFEIVKKNLSVIIQETGAVVTGSGLPVVQGNENQLIQLFQNLIGNAIKFHGTQIPEIQVGSRMDSQSGELIFWVKDNGIGISSEFFERIFVIFQRLHSRRKYEGTGIGLAICKRIVERHGGRIWVESEPDKGSTFYFTLSEKTLPAS